MLVFIKLGKSCMRNGCPARFRVKIKKKINLIKKKPCTFCKYFNLHVSKTAATREVEVLPA